MFSLQLWRNGFTEIFTLPSLLIYDLSLFVNVFSIMNNKKCVYLGGAFIFNCLCSDYGRYICKNIYIYTKYGNGYR